jgi:hypothetical protein
MKREKFTIRWKNLRADRGENADLYPIQNGKAPDEPGLSIIMRRFNGAGDDAARVAIRDDRPTAVRNLPTRPTR